MTGHVIDDSALRLRILAEYREMPGLRLAARQAARLWGLQPELCVATLDGLVADGRLGRSARGEYCTCGDAEYTRRSPGALSQRTPAKESVT